ncbi:hypothetical protein cyc_07834 [Cyclospora cayetanensis]|uniref:Uncharacterized protein n=1 Tax=Cyclospora cayetanensis TaxID=88456 RepID=A0A1D3D624_9EIME|nr:hypothetical protein cyc_07834 [Cyclospora cayetanensis]
MTIPQLHRLGALSAQQLPPGRCRIFSATLRLDMPQKKEPLMQRLSTLYSSGREAAETALGGAAGKLPGSYCCCHKQRLRRAFFVASLHHQTDAKLPFQKPPLSPSLDRTVSACLPVEALEDLVGSHKEDSSQEKNHACSEKTADDDASLHVSLLLRPPSAGCIDSSLSLPAAEAAWKHHSSREDSAPGETVGAPAPPLPPPHSVPPKSATAEAKRFAALPSDDSTLKELLLSLQQSRGRAAYTGEEEVLLLEGAAADCSLLSASAGFAFRRAARRLQATGMLLQPHQLLRSLKAAASAVAFQPLAPELLTMLLQQLQQKLVYFSTLPSVGEFAPYSCSPSAAQLMQRAY